MGKTKKPRKAYRARAVIVNPLNLMAPAPQVERMRLMTAFHTALDMMARHQSPTESEWRQLADAVNQVETLAGMGCLSSDEVMPSVDLAIKHMAEAAKRWRAGGALRLSGPGLEAVRDVLAFFEQALEGLPGADMHRARELTQQRIDRVRTGRTAGDKCEVIEV